MLAIVLLNLLSLTEVSAQNYSSETGKTCTGSGILCDAMNSEADIYTVMIGESEYEFNDYSEYGDFSQEVVFSDGTSYLYGLDPYGEEIHSYASEGSTYSVGTSYISDSQYANSSKYATHDLIVKSNGNYEQTQKRVTNLMSSRSSVTGHETAAYKLVDGNYVILKDGKNTRTSAEVSYVRNKETPSYECNGYRFPIEDFYHSHPKVNIQDDMKNPLYISTEDVDTVKGMGFDHFYIVNDGKLYKVFDFRKFGQSVIYQYNTLYQQ